MIAKIIWRSLPALVEFDAVNKSGGVELVGKIATTTFPMSVKRLEYMADASGHFQTLQNFGSLPINHGGFKFTWDSHGEGFRDGTSFQYRVTLTDGTYDYPQKVGSNFVYKSWLGKFREDHPFVIHSRR